MVRISNDAHAGPVSMLLSQEFGLLLVLTTA